MIQPSRWLRRCLPPASLLIGACSFGDIQATAPDYAMEQEEDTETTVTESPPQTTGEPEAAPSPPVETSEPNAPEPQEPGSIEQNLTREILLTSCGSCHGPGGSGAGNFDFIDNLDELIDSGLVVPGQPDRSALLRRMKEGSMPPPAVDNRPSDSDIDAVEAWILGLDTGTPQFDCAEFMTIDSMFGIMLRDVQSIDREDRPFVRYLTLANLSNAGLCEEALEPHRAAVSKMLNSVSLDSRVTRPIGVDANGLIQRIDLRDYQWDRELIVEGVLFADGWEAIVAQTPYGLQFDGDAADDLEQLTETEVFFLSVEAFVQVAAEPPLYYDLLDLPRTLQALEAQLGVDPAAQMADGRAIRAGFKTSDVSQQDRVIERLEQPSSANSYYYKSFDFADGTGEESIFKDPLRLQEDGGEMIFTLPNGLHAYVIADAAGQRLDEAPVAVVADPGQKDFTIRSGVSCMSCHTAGIIPKEDQVRDFVAARPLEYNSEDFEQVMETYIPKSEFNLLQEQDQQVYLAALTSSGAAGFLSDPVTLNFRSFEADMELARLAGDLMITESLLLTALPKLDPELQVATDAPIDRDVFTTLFLDTMCIVHSAAQNFPADCRGR